MSGIPLNKPFGYIITDLGIVETVIITGGTLDDVIIGGDTPAAATFTDLTATGNIALGDGDDTIVFNPAAAVSFSDKNITNVGNIALDTISAANGSSFSMSSNWTNAGNTIADLGVVTTVDINGGTLDGTVVGGATPAAGTFTALTATGNIALGDGDDTIVFNPTTSVSFSEKNITNVGNIALDSISADGGSSFSISNNWTNAGNTIADLGVVTTVDINGGTLDNVVIGGSTAVAGTFTNLTATGNIALGDGNDTIVFNPAAAVSFSDKNITNVGNIALDTISSDSGTNVRVILGTGSGNEFTVYNGAVNLLVTAGDTLITTVQSIETLSTNGLIIPASDTYAFSRTGDSDTGMYFNTSTTCYEFHRDGNVRGIISARADAQFSFEGVGDVSLVVAADTFAFALKGALTSGMFFNSTSSQLEIRFGNTVRHVFGSTGILQIDNNMIIGSGVAGADYTLTFDGENNNGIITWMEDEDYFQFSDDILMVTTEKVLFRDTAIGAYSQADTFLDFYADGGIRIGDSSSGAPTNYAQFASDGELTLTGTARVIKEIQIKAEALKLGGTAPGAAIVGVFSVLQFAGVGGAETVYTSFHMPTDWASGTDINVHIHWAPTNGNAGTVVWQMTWNALASENDEVISGAGTTTSVSDATQELQDELLESGDMTIAAAGLAAEDTIGISIFRDPAHGSDNYGSDASFVIMEISYTANKLGEAT